MIFVFQHSLETLRATVLHNDSMIIIVVTSHKVEVNSSCSNRIPGMVQNRVTLSGCYSTPLGCKYFIVIYPRFVPTGTARVGYYYFVPPEQNKPNRYPRYVPEEQNNPSPRVQCRRAQTVGI